MLHVSGVPGCADRSRSGWTGGPVPPTGIRPSGGLDTILVRTVGSPHLVGSQGCGWGKPMMSAGGAALRKFGPAVARHVVSGPGERLPPDGRFASGNLGTGRRPPNGGNAAMLSLLARYALGGPGNSATLCVPVSLAGGVRCYLSIPVADDLPRVMVSSSSGGRIKHRRMMLGVT